MSDYVLRESMTYTLKGLHLKQINNQRYSCVFANLVELYQLDQSLESHIHNY